MQKIKITLLGGAAVGIGNELVHFRTEPCLLLFVYLAVHIGRKVPHNEIIHAVWPDEKSVSKNRIAATSYLVRKSLPPGFDLIRAENGCLYIDSAIAETDLDLLISQPQLEHYTGPPIPFVRAPWADRLRQEILASLPTLDPEGVRRLLEVDPGAAGFLCRQVRETAQSNFDLAQTLLSTLSECLPLELCRAGSELWQLRLELADEIVQAKRQRLYCAFLSDTGGNAAEESTTVASLGIRGRTGDFFLFNNPVHAAQAAREVLDSHTDGRVLLTIVLLSPNEPLPLGLRSTLRQLPHGKSYCSWLVRPHLETRMEVGFEAISREDRLFAMTWE